MPGTLPVRRLTEHVATGARVNDGDALFLTWSQNEQQYGLFLRLIRSRIRDPMLHVTDPVDEALRQCSVRDAPSITEDGNAVATARLPLYNTGRCWDFEFAVSDRHAMTSITTRTDNFATSTLPMGGVAGLAVYRGHES